ncbi:MAG: tRNA dimethylallyltransferase [Quinella sp. 2Q5]|nr:tRNA dimethylallyltransferase [Quinella sp. 2Q5]
MSRHVKDFDAAPLDLTKIFDSVQSLLSASSPREKLVVILGATGTGKSALALTLAQAFDTEIISADSMAVYKNFNVGTAKPTPSELQLVHHHMTDIIDADERFSVGEFVRRAKPIITDINRRGKIPIVAGGTGLYVQALVEGYEFGAGKSFVSHYKRTGELIYAARVFGLTATRDEIYARINRRTAQMFANGLVDEVRGLLASGVSPTSQAMGGIGYKETVEYLAGAATLDETVAKVSQATRNFAKRQLTWFRRMKYIEWLKIFDALQRREV